MKLLKSYPDGVTMGQIYDLYQEAYHEPIVLSRIENGMTSIKLLQNYPDVFNLLENQEKQVVVCLQEAIVEKNNSTSAKLPARTVVITKTAGRPSDAEMEKAAQFNFTAVDVGTRKLNSESFETVTIIPVVDDEATKRFVPDTFGMITSLKLFELPFLKFISYFFHSVGPARSRMKNVVTDTTVFLYEDFSPKPYEYFFIILGEVYSPGKFYWIFSDNHKALESLSDDMMCVIFLTVFFLFLN